MASAPRRRCRRPAICWRGRTGGSAVVAPLGAWLQPATDRLAKVRWTLWRQDRRARAQLSHYQRRGAASLSPADGWSWNG
jgi:hypothetical protein